MRARVPAQKARDIRVGIRVTCHVNAGAAAEKLAALAHQSLGPRSPTW